MFAVATLTQNIFTPFPLPYHMIICLFSTIIMIIRFYQKRKLYHIAMLIGIDLTFITQFTQNRHIIFIIGFIELILVSFTLVSLVFINIIDKHLSKKDNEENNYDIDDEYDTDNDINPAIEKQQNKHDYHKISNDLTNYLGQSKSNDIKNSQQNSYISKNAQPVNQINTNIRSKEADKHILDANKQNNALNLYDNSTITDIPKQDNNLRTSQNEHSNMPQNLNTKRMSENISGADSSFRTLQNEHGEMPQNLNTKRMSENIPGSDDSHRTSQKGIGNKQQNIQPKNNKKPPSDNTDQLNLYSDDAFDNF